MKIWLLVEEVETGTAADGSTNCVLSAHRTEKGADDARDAWRAAKCEGTSKPHEMDENNDWCLTCGFGVTVDSTELSE